jgi:endonuclease III
MERYRLTDNHVAPDVSDMLENIPGIGIIRLRALKKAGWHSISALRKATLEDLLAVPGITPIKAQQILDYVQSLPEDPTTQGVPQDQEAASSDTTSHTSAQERQPPPGKYLVHSSQPKASTSIETAQAFLQRITLSASLLLSHLPTNDPDGKLAKQLSRWIDVCEQIQAAANISEKKVKRALAGLERVCLLLEKAAARDSIGNKRVSQLIEELREQRRELKKLGLA